MKKYKPSKRLVNVIKTKLEQAAERRLKQAQALQAQYGPKKRPDTPRERWQAAGSPKKRKAMITQSGKYSLKVVDEFGQEVHFIKGSIHYPGDLKEGTRGTIEFQLGPSYGLYFFTPEKRKKGSRS